MNDKPQKQWFPSTPKPQELMRLRDFSGSLDGLRAFGLQKGMSTGWRSVDELYTVRPREWTLVTGIPSHGKSTWLDNLMVNLSTSEELWHFAIFSAENLPLERHAATLISQFKRKPLEELTDKEYRDAQVWLDLGFAFICPREEDYTVDRILELAHLAVQEDPLIKGVVIDPWNELDHSRPSSMNETEHVSRCLTRIRRFARDHEVHVFLVAHPTKLRKMQNTEEYPVPTPYDVSGSAHFRNKADCCICVWRDLEDPANQTTIYVQKIRFREIGKVGSCVLNYDWRSGRLVDPKPSIVDYTNRREPGSDDE